MRPRLGSLRHFSLPPTHPQPETRMFQRLIVFFRPSRSRRQRDHPGTPANDQPNLRNAHRDLPVSESRVTTDAEASSALSKNFLDQAQKLRHSFPRTCSWLGPKDLQDIGELAVDGGRFADVRKGRLDGRDVAVKTYRCYVRFDCNQIRMVSYTRSRYGLYRQVNTTSRGSTGKHTHTASSRIGTSCRS